MTSRAPRTLPALLVPGLGLGEESWVPMMRTLLKAEVLDAATTTTALLKGYGLPRGHGESLAPDALARDVVDQMAPAPAALLIALSASCQVAAHVALQVPERVAGLVLIGPTTDPRAATWPRLVRQWVATVRSEPMHQIPVLLRQYRRTGASTMIRAMDTARRDRIDSVLPRLRCPILVIRGAHDHIAPEDWTASLISQPRAAEGHRPAARRRVTLSAGAHMVPYTHGDLVAQAIGDFLTLLDE